MMGEPGDLDQAHHGDDEQLVRNCLGELLSSADPDGPREVFMGTQFDLGLAWVHFPPGHGGLGVAPALQTIVDENLDAFTPHRPRRLDILGHGMGAPLLVAHGTTAQMDRWLRPMYTGSEIWCQMFSEPGAGSDLAALATQAIEDGEEWIVNGQKVWTTVAHLSKWGMLVARTEPQLPKHKGLTFFVVDMEGDGVEIRPLRQITGDAEFNEVYFTDARIPADQMIGNRGEGWRAALTTLMNERVAIGGRTTERDSGAIGQLVDIWTSQGGSPSERDRVMRVWVEAEVARLTNLRAQQNRDAGTPGPEGSTAKLVYSELNKIIYELATDLMGPVAMLYAGYDFNQPEVEETRQGDLSWHFLRSRANSIEGGTSEIMKNILGERVLGLPGEPRSDRDQAWTEVPRS